MEQKIKEIITNILKNLGVAFDAIELQEVAGQQVFSIKTTETKKLLGFHGETIQAIDYLTKKILEKNGIETPHFIVDTDNYRIEQIQSIQQKALIMAERARSFEYDVEMPPMSAYERLIVHATLQGQNNIKTESQGTGSDRRLVIRYVAQNKDTQEGSQ